MYRTVETMKHNPYSKVKGAADEVRPQRNWAIHLPYDIRVIELQGVANRKKILGWYSQDPWYSTSSPGRYYINMVQYGTVRLSSLKDIN